VGRVPAIVCAFDTRSPKNVGGRKVRIQLAVHFRARLEACVHQAAGTSFGGEKFTQLHFNFPPKYLL
jgi:hypothetical protein